MSALLLGAPLPRTNTMDTQSKKAYRAGPHYDGGALMDTIIRISDNEETIRNLRDDNRNLNKDLVDTIIANGEYDLLTVNKAKIMRRYRK